MELPNTVYISSDKKLIDVSNLTLSELRELDKEIDGRVKSINFSIKKKQILEAKLLNVKRQVEKYTYIQSEGKKAKKKNVNLITVNS